MISSARIVGVGVSYEAYSRQKEGIKRGHPEWIMSRSELVNFASNPRRWFDGYKADDSDTSATIFGKLLECLAGLSGKFDDFYAIAPAEYKDEKTGAMKPWNGNSLVCKAWKEDQGEREVIKSELLEKAKLAVWVLRNDPDVSELFNVSKKQIMVSGIWEDTDTGISIPIRCLLDLVPDVGHQKYGQFLADFKSTRNGCPDFWDRTIDSFGYDVQAALSTDLYVAATGEDRNTWIFPVQENVHPYHIVKPMSALSVEFLAWGREKYQQALKFYAQCLSFGTWPSYSTGNRLVVESCQFISPDAIWKYRESGGAVARNIVECQRMPAPVNSNEVTP